MVYDSAKFDDDSWKVNATKWHGVPLYPAGEIPLVDFFNGKQENYSLSHSAIQARMAVVYPQMTLALSVSLIFMRNLRRSVKLLIAQPHNLSGWCCLVPSICGASLFICISMLMLSNEMNCRKAVWYIAFMISISLVFNTAVVLQRAYLALCQKFWIAVVGVLFSLPQLAFIYIVVWYSPVSIEPNDGCVIHYPDFLAWFWAGASIPINAFLTAVFSYITYNQYNLYGSDAWKRLARDGIQAMVLVISCNVVCTLILLSKVAGSFTEMFFVIDWYV
ncbi:hypothetical protein BDF19DRAFT_437027 [Syncephalis fuscata]|nr:hypothetical protein BDF19DRAFT_437027 [Syncephalis fuscata]